MKSKKVPQRELFCCMYDFIEDVNVWLRGRNTYVHTEELEASMEV